MNVVMDLKKMIKLGCIAQYLEAPNKFLGPQFYGLVCHTLQQYQIQGAKPATDLIPV